MKELIKQGDFESILQYDQLKVCVYGKNNKVFFCNWDFWYTHWIYISNYVFNFQALFKSLVYVSEF